MKQIILLVALLGVVLSAAAPTCDATNGAITMGVCQYCDPTCKTCKTLAADKCTSCNTGFTAPSDTTAGGACTCGGTNKLIPIADKVITCAAPATVTAANVPHGYGIVEGTAGTATTQHILPCTAVTAAHKFCSQCTSTGSSATANTVATTCSSCDGSTAATTCTAVANSVLIRHKGWFDACPAGYVADADKVCQPCAAGCAACAADKLGECTACAAGHIIDTTTKLCVAATATGATACDTSCESLKCQNTAKNCTACKDATYEFTAAGTCTLKPTVQLCKTVDTADAKKCKADGCMDNATLAADASKCDCKPTHWFKKVTFDGTKTPVVAHAYECAACAKTCATGQRCKSDGTDCETDPNAGAGGAAGTCTDATALKGGCAKCDKVTKDSKDTFPCTACNATLKFDSATASCACEKTSDEAVWDAVNMNCAVCTPKCTDTTKKFCSIKTAAASKGAAPVTECSGTEPAKPPTTTGTPANNNAGTTASNGILISALSLLSLVFLA